VVATGTTSTITRRAIVVVVVGAVVVVARRVVVVTTGRNVVEVVDVEVVDVVTTGRKVVEVDVVANGRTVVDVDEVDVVTTRLRVVVVVVVRRGRTVLVVTTAGARVDDTTTEVVVEVEVSAGAADPEIVTVIDCGEPASDVVVFPAVSVIENEPAAVSVDTTAPPPAVAVEATFSVQTFEVVWTIDEIAEIPAVNTKSELAVVESVAQLMASLPVTVKLIDADDAVAVDAARVTVVGAVRSMVTERDAESGP
jgi:hypothetical protein